jgi:hypothetical protein
MTVKELINKLLDAPMDAEALISVSSDLDTSIFAVKVTQNQYARGGAYVDIMTEGDYVEAAEESP